ncbi:MAG TPA: ABC transporter permease [Gemmatimonadaceae bacterium]|nr:ABC transporter permease [Gemmatimonadaceae bacterium]
MHTLLDDLRFARRMFARRRRFALLLVATIAVGIGAATSIFSLVDVVLWKPLPYRDAERLYWIARTDSSWRASPVLSAFWDNLGHTLTDYRTWAEAQHSFDATGAWFATNGVLATGDGVEQISTARATASLASLLGIRPALGRWFLPGEDARGGARLAVLSFETWQTRFGSDPAILGRRLTLNGNPTEIVGVLPNGFRIAGDTAVVELWTPAGVAAGDWQPGNYNFRVFGRLRPGVSVDAATREAMRLLAVSDQPGRNGVRLENLQQETVKGVRTPLTLLLVAAALLLAIACGNVATLLVGETSARDVEISTRVSLGATSSRVVRQLLTENFLMAATGGTLGCVLAVILVRVLRVMAPAGIPRIESAHVDARGVAFAVAITLLTALVFSLAPLVAVLRTSPASTMRAGSSRITRQRGSLERGGVFVQSALVVVLLAGAVLLVRTHQALIAVDPGFRAANVLSVRLRFLPPVTRYRDATSRRVVLDELAAKLRALPGVASAAAAFAVPFQGASTTDIHIAGSPAVTERDEVAGTYVIAAPRFFETMGIQLRAGRRFEPVDDGPGSVTVVSEGMARRYWPNASAVGQRILVDGVWRTVVGVAADVRHRSVDEETRSTFYLPAAQAGERLLDAVVLRTTGDPREQIAAVRRLVAAQDPTLAIARADRLSDLVEATLVAERFRALLLTVFAGTAVLLAAIGIVGVATNAATRRRRELAIRMAVGATPAMAVRLIVTGTLGTALVGAGVGLVAALGATRALRPFLYGISSSDPTAYAVVVLLIVAVATGATWLPARHTTRIDLMRTLSAD